MLCGMAPCCVMEETNRTSGTHAEPSSSLALRVMVHCMERSVTKAPMHTPLSPTRRRASLRMFPYGHPHCHLRMHWAGAVLRHSWVRYRFTELYEDVTGPVNENTRLTRNNTPDVADVDA